MRQTGRPYSGDGDCVFSLRGRDSFLRCRVAAGKGELDRVKSSDAIAPWNVWDDSLVLLLFDDPKYAARFGTDDTIFVSDFYRDNRNFYPERKRYAGAMDILYTGVRRRADDRTGR